MATTTEATGLFDGLRSFADVNARYKDLYWTMPGAGEYPVSPEIKALSEALRLKLVDVTVELKGDRFWQSSADGNPVQRSTGATRTRRPPVRPVEHEDGRTTIVCTVCHEEKPVKAYPTKSGKPGVREDRCRACRDASKGAVAL